MHNVRTHLLHVKVFCIRKTSKCQMDTNSQQLRHKTSSFPIRVAYFITITRCDDATNNYGRQGRTIDTVQPYSRRTDFRLHATLGLKVGDLIDPWTFSYLAGVWLMVTDVPHSPIKNNPLTISKDVEFRYISVRSSEYSNGWARPYTRSPNMNLVSGSIRTLLTPHHHLA